MKKCELCQLPATLHCESDQAFLCAGCDLKVHEANFLVARHTRTLLCKTCQSATSWKACGARLGITVTECEKCTVVGPAEDEESDDGVVDEATVTDDDEFYSDESDEDWNEDDEEECENQVVPLTYDASSFSSLVCDGRRLPAIKRLQQNEQ